MRRVILTLALAAFAAGVAADGVAADGAAAPVHAQDPQAAASKSATAPVNINTATVEQLEGLPGIGAKTAGRIVEYRQKNGPFKKVEDLMNVQGIGEKNFLKLKTLLTVTPPKTDKASGG